jgi:hypothetical protein
MERLKYIIIAGFLFVIIACNNRSVNNKLTPKDSITVDSSLLINPPTNTSQSYEQSDTTTTIKFNEFTLTISRLIVWDEQNLLNKIQGDTCYVFNDIGETVLGQKIFVAPNKLSDFKIEQRYETSVSISNEGPHCDLTNWKHYLSDWMPLKAENENVYLCSNYTEKEKEKFPVIDIKDLKEQVEKQCGDTWVDLVKNINKPTQEPSWVGISRVYLRLTGKLNGQAITKIIVFEEAMGC